MTNYPKAKEMDKGYQNGNALTHGISWEDNVRNKERS